MTATTRLNTHYDVLEVVEHASPEVIRGAYKHLQQKWHPDRNASSLAAVLAGRINSAYEVLSDPVLREAYDEQLKGRRVVRAPEPAPGMMTRRDWFAGGVFFLSLASVATNSLSSPATPTARPASLAAQAHLENLELGEQIERQRRRSDLLSRMILNAEGASAREQDLEYANELAGRKAASRESTTWWRDAALLAEGDFKLKYAGTIEGDSGIGLLFSSVPDLRSLNRNAVVLKTDGTRAEGRWRLGKNRQLAHFGSFGPGRYTVVLKPNLEDESGQVLGLKLAGPIVTEDYPRPGRRAQSRLKSPDDSPAH